MHNQNASVESEVVTGVDRAKSRRTCMVRAQSHLNSAMRAVDQGRFEVALRHTVASRSAVEAFVVAGGEPCKA